MTLKKFILLLFSFFQTKTPEIFINRFGHGSFMYCLENLYEVSLIVYRSENVFNLIIKKTRKFPVID